MLDLLEWMFTIGVRRGVEIQIEIVIEIHTHISRVCRASVKLYICNWRWCWGAV
jgi:hypothetical protein